jgi:hypothetical protein
MRADSRMDAPVRAPKLRDDFGHFYVGNAHFHPLVRKAESGRPLAGADRLWIAPKDEGKVGEAGGILGFRARAASHARTHGWASARASVRH